MEKIKKVITSIKKPPSKDLIVVLRNGRRVIFKDKR